MNGICERCPNERVHEVHYRVLSDALKEVKERVGRLEITLARGVMLLVANLAGIVISLAHEFVNR